MDVNEKEIMLFFEVIYGKDQVVKWWVFWCIFYMLCVELWGFWNGEEWFVSYYFFEKNW